MIISELSGQEPTSSPLSTTYKGLANRMVISARHCKGATDTSRTPSETDRDSKRARGKTTWAVDPDSISLWSDVCIILWRLAVQVRVMVASLGRRVFLWPWREGEWRQTPLFTAGPFCSLRVQPDQDAHQWDDPGSGIPGTHLTFWACSALD